MGELKKKYIVDEENRRIAVQIDIKDFEEVEEGLENYALAQLIKLKRTGRMILWMPIKPRPTMKRWKNQIER